MAIATTKSRKRRIVVRDSGHPAAFNKIRCPKCSLGYAVKSMTDPSKYVCTRCGVTLSVGRL